MRTCAPGCIGLAATVVASEVEMRRFCPGVDLLDDRVALELTAGATGLEPLNQFLWVKTATSGATEQSAWSARAHLLDDLLCS